MFEGDEMWTHARTPTWSRSATAELERLGLVRPGVVEAGYVVRMPKAYPVYDERYQHNVDVIRAWLAEARRTCTRSGATACTATTTRTTRC